MLTLLLQSLAKQKQHHSAASTDRRPRAFSVTAFAFVAMMITTLAGCGSGGYPGGGITGLSSTSATIDAGQTYQITASVTSNPTVTWTVSGAACGTSCGTVTGTGNTTTYTAPSGITKPIVVTVTATITGTSVSSASTITVNPDPTITGSPAAGTVGVPYTAKLTAVPGTAPLTLSVVSSSLPPGLSFNTQTGVISGTPTTAGTYTVQAQVVDSSATPFTAKQNFPIQIFTSTPPPPTALTLTGILPGGTVGTTYVGQLTAAGGVTPYTYSISNGTFPAGLTLNASTGAVTGSPTTATTYTFTAQVKDSTGTIATAPFTVNIVNAGTPLVLGNPPPATQGQPYTGTIPVTGGTGPYSCVLAAGSPALPAGLSLVPGTCNITGTPTTSGPVTVQVTATDSTNPTPETTTGPVTITVNAAAATLTIGNPPGATQNVPYLGTVPVTGGTAPYTCTSITGTLPAGLTVSGCNISGTPTQAGTFPLTVTAHDNSSPQNTVTGPATLTVAAPTTVITLGNPPPVTSGTPYTGLIPVTGGTAPYSCVVTAGSLPAGLSIVPGTCEITGTTTGTTTTVTVTATDPNGNTGTGPVTITVNPPAKLSLVGTLPPAIVNKPYSQTIPATGGTTPYTYTITAGTLPNGITLDPNTGTFSGTPTKVGAYSFTETVTDNANPKATASLPLVLQVIYDCTAAGTHCAYLNGPYAYLFQGFDDGLLGVLTYQTASVGSFTANGAGLIGAGELDANHQTSTAATGNTVTTQQFLGAYIINADNRGLITITTLNADGTVNATQTYEVAVKAPVSPATNSAQGSLTQSDSNSLAGTKGSGSLLAQTATSFATGLSGTYAFGVQGDTPCLLTCALNIGGLPILTGGPVAAVGEFTASGNAVTGNGDSNVGAANVANSVLAGSYAAADSNGRVQLAMTTSKQQVGVFPTDYAVYMVNANQAFILSTNVHSTFDLLAGTTTLQTGVPTTNTANAGSFVGYENSATNPGLVGATLQGVTNFSTATIFQATNGGNGTCTVNKIDQAGATSLVSNITGILGNLLGGLLQGILGTYTTTGQAACTVGANGRGTIAYPQQGGLLPPAPPAARVVYYSSPNTGYFLETAYAALGRVEAQSAIDPATTFTGTYIFGATPATSVASIDSSGVIVSNGNKTATATLDLTVGVGTLNVLTLGSTGNYTYTAPDQYGRFTMNTSSGGSLPTNLVIYEINPGRYVTVDTNVLTTSPVVDLLY